MTLKEYCVHVTLETEEHDDIQAASPAHALKIALARSSRSPSTYTLDDIWNVQVFVVCSQCQTDNDLLAAMCDQCEQPL